MTTPRTTTHLEETVTTTLTPTALQALDRITDQTPDDLAGIKTSLELARHHIDADKDLELASDWVDEALDLLVQVAARLGYVLDRQ